jgi:hypothetical protein
MIRRINFVNLHHVLCQTGVFQLQLQFLADVPRRKLHHGNHGGNAGDSHLGGRTLMSDEGGVTMTSKPVCARASEQAYFKASSHSNLPPAPSARRQAGQSAHRPLVHRFA